MSEKRDFGELFAVPLVRHSIELASTLWGLSLCVVDENLSCQFPASTSPHTVELFSGLLSHKRYRKAFTEHYATFFVATPDWTGPRWIEPIAGVRQLVTPVGVAAGTTYLLCVPFLFREEQEENEYSELKKAATYIAGTDAGRAVDMVPALGQLERRKVQTHMSTLSREFDLLLARASRRSGDGVRRYPRASGVTGKSSAAEYLRRFVKAAASEDNPVLITGEIGTGKRTCVRIIHQLSGRRSQPLVDVDCQNTPGADLVNRLLGPDWTFGKVPALEKIVGGGTVFFHEVGFLPPVLQHLLLSYLDRWESPTGRLFRLVATSSLPLEGLEQLRTLRPELLLLLRGNVLECRPLQKRIEDIPELAAEMLMQIRAGGTDVPSEFNATVLQAMKTYSWPGNLWELRSEVRTMAARSRGRNEIGVDSVSSRIGTSVKMTTLSANQQEEWVSMPEAVESLERTMLLESLSATRWNRSRTAKLLGISRRNLIRKIERYKLDRRKRTQAIDLEEI